MGHGQSFDVYLQAPPKPHPPNTSYPWPWEDTGNDIILTKFETPFYSCSETTWPRLQSSLEKPHWISVDFERFEYQDDSEPEAEEEEEGEEGEMIDPEKLKRIVRLCSVHFVCFIHCILIEGSSSVFVVVFFCFPIPRRRPELN
jgi:hypothetical protein